MAINLPQPDPSNYQDPSHSTAHLLGALPPKYDPRTLMMHEYVGDVSAPDDWDLETQYKLSFEPFRGQKLGSCTISSQAEAVRRWERAINFGQDLYIPDDMVDQRYLGLSGGQDTGLFELDALNDFIKNGFKFNSIEYHIDAFTKISEHDPASIRTGVYTFRGIKICFDVRLNFYHSNPDDIVRFDPNSASVGYHSMYADAYNAQGLWVVHTWNRKRQLLAWDYVGACATEAYTCVVGEDIRLSNMIDTKAIIKDAKEAQNTDIKPEDIVVGPPSPGVPS